MSFETEEAADALVAEIERTVGRERLACVHVDDSKVQRRAPGSTATRTSAGAPSASWASSAAFPPRGWSYGPSVDGIAR